MLNLLSFNLQTFFFSFALISFISILNDEIQLSRWLCINRYFKGKDLFIYLVCHQTVVMLFTICNKKLCVTSLSWTHLVSPTARLYVVHCYADYLVNPTTPVQCNAMITQIHHVKGKVKLKKSPYIREHKNLVALRTQCNWIENAQHKSFNCCRKMWFLLLGLCN